MGSTDVKYKLLSMLSVSSKWAKYFANVQTADEYVILHHRIIGAWIITRTAMGHLYRRFVALKEP